MDQLQYGSRIVYPRMPEPLTESDLAGLFTVSPQEDHWARTVARKGPSLAVLLTHLKVFQHVGRFLPIAELPAAAVSFVVAQARLEMPLDFGYDRRTLYRHHRAIREFLGITPWGAKARAIASGAIATAAEARVDPADLINAAIDALIRERCELPMLSTLRELAATAHRLVNAAQWEQVHERLSEAVRQELDALLTPSEDAQESRFAVLCRGAGKATRENLGALIAHYEWLMTLTDPVPILAPISEAKVTQWANEARRLKAPELREYVAPRRYALVLAALRVARGRVLDDLTVMLLRFSGRVAWRSEQYWEEVHIDQGEQTDALINTLAELLEIVGADSPRRGKLKQLEAAVEAHGGCEALRKACAEHEKQSKRQWQPFAHQAFSPYRTALLHLARILPLKAARDSSNVLLKAVLNVSLEPSTCDYYDIIDLDRGFIPAEWQELVGDGCADRPRVFNRRHLEVVAILELAEAIKAGAVNVAGSMSYEDFWGQLPTEAGDPERIAAYAAERGWPAGAAGLTAHLRDKLEHEACQLDTDVGLLRTVQLDKSRRPIVPRITASELPVSVAQAVRQVLEEMPERSVLEALANTAQWANWPQHFGLPSRLGSGIENVQDRYVITTFAYGCGLGPAQAARHFGGAVTAEDLSFVDRRHVDIADLRAGSADLQNLYSQFELPKLWGTGTSAAADGTHFETFRNNLLAAHHFRYGKTGGIAYRHISDNYIALFSRFIGCGIYEATYILDILQTTLSDFRPTRLHADSHGQSAHVFGLAFLLGIELMPRIRGWKRLKLYRPGGMEDLDSIKHLFTATINWRRIEEHYSAFMRLALAIHSGKLAPSAVLARINSHSSRDPFSMALQELGHAVRTAFLLRWIRDGNLRRDVHKGTTKVERSHQFAKFLNFGSEGGLKTNSPEDQEKAIVYNELVANAVAVQTVADQTQALHELRRHGIEIAAEDLAHFSPYPTSRIRRFGEYPALISTEILPPNKQLPLRRPTPVAQAA
jgi:TnpA family transposase